MLSPPRSPINLARLALIPPVLFSETKIIPLLAFLLVPYCRRSQNYGIKRESRRLAQGCLLQHVAIGSQPRLQLDACRLKSGFRLPGINKATSRILFAGKPTQWPALALTECRDYNEQETNAVFYGSNHFHLVDTTARREISILQAFLSSITSTNAHLLSHLSLSFPALEAIRGRSEASGLRQDGMRSLKLLQDNCANVRTLELSVHHGNAFGLVEEAPSNSQSLNEALSQVDTQLKAISSLQRIVIRYYHDRPTPGVRQLMQGLGWIVLMGDKELS